MTVAVYVEGDFTKLFSDDVRSFADLKGQVRIEYAVEPELAKNLVELARAADALKRAAEVEGKIKETERALKFARGRNAKESVKELERELKKLRKIRGRVRTAADAAEKKVLQLGESMKKTPLGRLASKYAGKALAIVFKKFIPLCRARHKVIYAEYRIMPHASGRFDEVETHQRGMIRAPSSLRRLAAG